MLTSSIAKGLGAPEEAGRLVELELIVRRDELVVDGLRVELDEAGHVL